MTAAVAPPRLLGPYCLLCPLAEGGMGAVHIATALDEPDERLCLVKTLKPGVGQGHGDEYLRRFLDEARVAVCLQGEHLCHVFDAGEADGELFLAMELIEGVTFRRLTERLAQTKTLLPPPQAITLGLGMLEGLHAAHTACDAHGQALGVVHRDVSPQNIMVDRFGRVKVIDFGLATSTLKETVTEQAVVMGKMAYMAPEQARGEPVTSSADQYAAAVVIYELLTGDRFYGDLPNRGIWGIVGAGTHQPRAWAQIPDDVAPILQRALAPTAAQRWPDCLAFAAALRALSPASPAERQAALSSWIKPFLAGEFAPIDEARARLRDLPATVRLGVAEATERVRVRLQGPSSTSRSLQGAGFTIHEPTEAVRSLSRAKASTSPTPQETIASPSRRRPWAALLVVGAVVVGVGGLVAVGLGRSPSSLVAELPPPPPPVAEPLPPPSPAPPPPDSMKVSPPAVPPPVAPPPVAPAPVAPAPVAPPPVAPPPVAPPPVAPRPATGSTKSRPNAPSTPVVSSSLAALRVRVQQLEGSCRLPCVSSMLGVVRGLTTPEQKAVDAASRLLSKCEAQCRE